MNYFIPNWEDRLDREFDFINDKFSPGRLSVADDVYAHNIFSKSPYDGIIMSLNIFGDKIKVNGQVDIKGYENRSIKDYLKTKKQNLKIICDCGAFSYLLDKTPPEKYTVEYISRIYDKLKFDFGVSVDHLIWKNLSKKEKEYRRKLSTDNAVEFIEHWREKKYNFKPIGSVQGDDINGYKKSLKKLIDAGYDYVGLGTLIPRSDEFIVELVKELNPIFKKTNVKVHLFGILRKDIIEQLKHYGAHSFDSASFLRKAWLRSDNNYFGIDQNWYSAIRVPIIESKTTEKKLYDEGLNVDKLKAEQFDILHQLNDFDKGNEKLIDELIAKIVDYDKTLIRTSEDSGKYEPRYREVLESKIWKKCNCEMCKQAGIHIVVFRRTNRNKRRGFHNTWVFYNQILSKIK